MKEKIELINKLAATTPYPVNDILDFMMLTGVKHCDIEKIITCFSRIGVSNLVDVNTLAKMDYLKLPN